MRCGMAEGAGNASSESSWVPLRRESVEPKLLGVIGAVLNLFPNLPVSVHKIMAMVYDPRSSAREISEIAALDPVLVSTILKKVNSSFYSTGQKVDNLNLAIVILGFNEVRNIALQCGLLKTLRKDDNPEFNTRDLWVHSYSVSQCNELLMNSFGKRRSGVLMTVGMLHDIGKFALYSIGVHAKRLGLKLRGVSDMNPDASLLEKEERLFGVNHAIVGGMLARKWNLSERIHSVLEYHHYPSFFPLEEVPEQFRSDVAVTSISDFIVNRLKDERSPVPIPGEAFFTLAGISQVEDFLTPSVKMKLESANNFLDELS
jgi:HD-like signal output (HDOD) protein